ncbi:Hly-III related protein, partial [Basidiobolus meristosporus CBS 931.73]
YNFEDIPEYLKDNPFIQTGYRAYYSYREALGSLFRIHNETGNIWTHFGGFIVILLVILPVQYSYFLPKEASSLDKGLFALLLLCAAQCLICSSLFHLFIGCSRKAFRKWGCWDYSGISTLICGCYCIAIYYCFYCQPVLRDVFLGIVVTVNLTGIIGPQTSVWSEPWFRLIRAGIYITSGAVSTIPILYWLIKHGFPSDMNSSYVNNVLGLSWGGLLALEMSIWISAVVIYAWRFPECFFPGKCDLFFHSHQIWHTMILLGILVHYQLSIQLLKWRLS